MEDMVIEIGQEPEEAGTGQQPEVAAGQQDGQKDSQQPEKLFTQEQVNEIVRKRLAKLKTDTQSLEGREATVTAREKRLDCREYLVDKGYPVELLDVIDTSDVEAFKQKADTALAVFAAQQRRSAAPLYNAERPPQNTDIDSAFSGKKKHTPKKFPPSFEE